ncbi:exported hypothetical protein [uncultured Paludibacter sp.]|uniref:Outer membrane protein beta-barrel domain-containing protein n=1 Tax=uncultured Paludibacter sp. TaxID=497635 RepID=A0A653A5T8_9BACT|nr:exported hypothetical protein [uncultured Paludibacter sp.]
MRKISLYFVFLIFSINVFAQDFRPGKVIMLNNDTLEGFIKYQSDKRNGNECLFRNLSNKTTNIYYPKDIKGYIFKNEKRTYQSDSVWVDNYMDFAFFEKLVLGKINLFYWFTNEHNSDYYIQKENSKLIPLPFSGKERYVIKENSKKLQTIFTTNNIDSLKKYMSDVPQIFPEIEKINYPRHSTMINLVEHYNYLSTGVKNKNDIIKATKRQQFICAGIEYSKYKTRWYEIWGGIKYSINPSKKNENFFITTGVFYSLAGDLSDSIKIKIPLSVEYIFSQKKIQPYFIFGYNFYIYKEPPFIPVAFIGLGTNIKVKDNIHINISTTAQLGILPLPQWYNSFNILSGVKLKI